MNDSQAPSGRWNRSDQTGGPFRDEAMQVRVCALTALFQNRFSRDGEGARVNAFRAAHLYSQMAARMDELLPEKSSAEHLQ